MNTVTTSEILNRSSDKIIEIILERFCIFAKTPISFLEKYFSFRGSKCKQFLI